MPYKGEDGSVSMYIFLPVFTVSAIDELLEKITPEILDDVFSGGLQREVDVEFPKISFERKFELVPVSVNDLKFQKKLFDQRNNIFQYFFSLKILKHMGVGDLFESTANLTEFSEKQSLKFDDAVHQAKIEIDEEGSVAAAATAIFSFRSSRPTEPAQFICNHPFMFVIHDQKSKEILFAGVYRGPSQ